MKIITKCIIDMTSMEDVYEESYDYQGEVALCVGGGGASGAVEYPAYIEGQHDEWLTDFDTIIDGYLAGTTPYDEETSYPTSADLAAIDTAVSTHDTFVDAIDEITDWDTMINKIVDKTREFVPYINHIDDAVNSFDERSVRRSMRSHGILAGQMAEIGGINGSAFAMGMAAIEEDRQNEVRNFEKTLIAEMERNRMQFIIQSTQSMLQIYLTQIDQKANVLASTIDANKTRISAKTQETNRNLEIDVLDAKWDLDLFHHAGNLLGSIAGTAVQPQQGGSPLGQILGVASTFLALL